MYHSYRQHAVLAQEFGLDQSDGEACFVAVGSSGDWPSLVVAQRFSPCSGGFDPGVLLVPETGVFFVGAGERLLAYTLQGPARLWEDQANTGFWSWQQHGNFVLMAAELELAAWDTHGKKLWTTFVEPPWTYRVEGEGVHLDVMGSRSSFLIADGPSSKRESSQ
jgi:hypothetical protein